jgi:hypothetical protein
MDKQFAWLVGCMDWGGIWLIPCRSYQVSELAFVTSGLHVSLGSCKGGHSGLGGGRLTPPDRGDTCWVGYATSCGLRAQWWGETASLRYVLQHKSIYPPLIRHCQRLHQARVAALCWAPWSYDTGQTEVALADGVHCTCSALVTCHYGPSVWAEQLLCAGRRCRRTRARQR